MPLSDDLSVALARLGMAGRNAEVAIRPILLRVAVDQFVQKPHHAPEDLRLFLAMVEPLLADADPATRRRMAERLFDHPETPAALLDRLMDDETVIAAELYRHASLPAEELLSAAATGSAIVAAIVAQRQGLPAAVIHALARRPEGRVVRALAANADAALAPADLQVLVVRARLDRDLAERLVTAAPDPAAVTALFPLVSWPQRRRIIDAVRRQALGRRAWGRPEGAAAGILHRLDHMALSGEWEGFDHTLCQALGCDERLLSPLLHDGTGDMLALALAAVGASGPLAARVFILGDPAIGRSVTAVRRLTALVETIAPAAAMRMIDAVMGHSPATARRPLATEAPPVPRADTAPSAPRREVVEPARRARG